MLAMRAAGWDGQRPALVVAAGAPAWVERQLLATLVGQGVGARCPLGSTQGQAEQRAAGWGGWVAVAGGGPRAVSTVRELRGELVARRPGPGGRRRRRGGAAGVRVPGHAGSAPGHGGGA